MWWLTASFSSRKNSRTPRSSPGCRSQCAEWQARGKNPRRSLCSPWAPGFEERDAELDAAFDPGVVGRLEVEELDLLVAAPVAAVEPMLGLEEERARDRVARAGDLEEADALGRELDEAMEEAASQILATAVEVGRAPIEAIEGGELAR